MTITPPRKLLRLAPRIVVALAAAVLTACATPRVQIPPPRIAGAPAPAAPAAEEQAAPDAGVAGAAGQQERPGAVRLTPPPRSQVTLRQQDLAARLSDTDAITVSTESMPLREFVNYVFGELLKLSYVVAQGIPNLEEPVTLSLQKPVSSRALYRLVAELLQARKIGVTPREGIVYLYALDPQAKGNVTVGFGRRPQDVPETAGRILQVVPLRYGMNISIERTVRDLVDAQVQPDPAQSALFVTGQRDAILRVLDIVGLLDQPATRAREVSLVSLTYIGSKDLTDQLAVLLENEGIPTGIGRADGRNVALVPLEQLGAIAVFASSVELLQRVQYWIRQIDKPGQGPEQRYFIYHPRNARAMDLGESLAPLIGGELPTRGNLARDTRSALGGSQGTTSMGQTSGATGGQNGLTTGASGSDSALRRDRSLQGSEQTPVAVKGEGMTMSVDPRSNTLVFYTTGLRYQSLLPMIQRLDVPPKQILLEATIAEVTLSGEFAMGVEWALTKGQGVGGTQGGLGLPAGGFFLNYIEGENDNIRLRLSGRDGLVNVLSNPSLVVRDGVEAEIAVGNDVPTVGASVQDPITSSRQVTTVLYRRTGLTLQVRPTINAAGLVVMEISQSISNTVDGASDVSGAPVFFERAVRTEVVSRSGQSILLAGLISDSRNDTSTNVPGLVRIPLLGKLFESRKKTREKTELVILLTARVIENPDEWNSIRAGLESALQYLQLPPARPVAPVAPASSDRQDDDVVAPAPQGRTRPPEGSPSDGTPLPEPAMSLAPAR